MFYVYILQGDHRCYVGQTEDLWKRYEEHTSGLVYSTSRMGVLKLLGYFEKDTRAEAMKLERMMKKNGHINHWINHPTFIKI